MKQVSDETSFAPARVGVSQVTSRARGRGYLTVVSPQPVANANDDGALQQIEIGPLDLEMGGHLSAVTMAYRTWGALNPAGDNAVSSCMR